MTFKTMAELNKAEPHLRDLEIIVDGLNVVDIQMAGPGTWVPRFTVQLSGDMGLNKVTGQRSVYLAAAEYLRSVLLGTTGLSVPETHSFVPHANVSRVDLDGDFNAAVSTAESAIAGLLKAYNEPVIDPEGNGPVENFEWFGKSLHIVVRTVDFDLTEKRILSGEAFEQLQSIIDEPPSPTPELVKLMSKQLTPRGNAGDINPELVSQPSQAFFNLAINPTDETKEINGVLHVSLTHNAIQGGVTTIYWVPAGSADQFQTVDSIINGSSLVPLGRGTEYVEWLVQPKEPTKLDVIPLDVRNTTTVENGGEPLAEDESELTVVNITKSFNGVLHTSVVLEAGLNAPNQVFWVPADHANEFPSLEAMRAGTSLICVNNRDDLVEYLVQLPPEDNAPEIEPVVNATTTLFDGIPHKRFERQDNGVKNVFWVPEAMGVVINQLQDIPDDLVMTIIADNGDDQVEWVVIGRK